MKKFTAILIALLLAVSTLFSITASADTPPLNYNRKGSLKLVKYEPDADTNNDSIPDDPTKLVSGAKFKAYQVIAITGNESSGRRYSVTPNFNSIEKLVELVAQNDGLSFTSTPELLKLIPDMRSAAAEIKDETTGGKIYDVAEDATSKGTYSASRMDWGVYLVVETKVPEGYSQVTLPFLVSLPQLKQSTEGDTVNAEWIYDVTAYPKDQKLAVNKTIDGGVKDGKEIDASIGDIINYTVESTIPDYYNSSNKTEGALGDLTVDQIKNIQYKFTDTMSKGLDFDEKSLKIFIDGEEQSFTEKANPEPEPPVSWDYELSTEKVAPEDNPSAEDSEKSTKITVNFNWATLNKFQGKKIELKYSAKLNNNAIIGAPGNPNEAFVTYTNDPTLIQDDGTIPTSDTKKSETTVFVNTVGMKLQKTLNGEIPADDSKVEDIEFSLSKPTGDASTEKLWFAKKVSSDGEYIVFDNSDPANKKNEGDEIKINDENYTVTQKLSPNTSGKLSVDGLLEGSYYLAEEKTISGYNLIPDAILIKIEFKKLNGVATGDVIVTKTVGGQTDNLTYTKDTNKFSITVDNPKQPFLPLAGAQGVISIILGGALLAIGAATLYYLLFKRKSKAQRAIN